jgi:hypothetical protein
MLLAAGAGALLCPRAFGEDLPRKIKPVMVWTGMDSKVDKEAFTRCGTAKEWEAVWRKHRAWTKKGGEIPPCPVVDFDEYMVIVIFHGEPSSHRDLKIIEVIEEKGCVRLRYEPPECQTGFNYSEQRRTEEETERDRRKPGENIFAFVVLPRIKKAIAVEVDAHRRLIGAAPEWEERAKLEFVQEK